MPGYSGTPLVKKLGINAGEALVTFHAPREYLSWLGELPDGARITSRRVKPIRAAHVFATKREALAGTLKELHEELSPDGFVWVSWPKKSAGVRTDITEDVIRDVALPLGFVDVKVCAVTDVWSGLKLVIRKSERRPR